MENEENLQCIRAPGRLLNPEHFISRLPTNGPQLSVIFLHITMKLRMKKEGNNGITAFSLSNLIICMGRAIFSFTKAKQTLPSLLLFCRSVGLKSDVHENRKIMCAMEAVPGAFTIFHCVARVLPLLPSSISSTQSICLRVKTRSLFL